MLYIEGEEICGEFEITMKSLVSVEQFFEVGADLQVELLKVCNA